MKLDEDYISLFQRYTVGLLRYFCFSLKFQFDGKVTSFLLSSRWRQSQTLPSPFSYFLSTYIIYFLLNVYIASYFDLSIFRSLFFSPTDFPAGAALAPAILVAVVVRLNGILYRKHSIRIKNASRRSVYTAFGTYFVIFSFWIVCSQISVYLQSRFPDFSFPLILGVVLFVLVAVTTIAIPCAIVDEVAFKAGLVNENLDGLYKYVSLAVFIVAIILIGLIKNLQQDKLVPVEVKNSRLDSLVKHEFNRIEKNMKYVDPGSSPIKFGPPVFDGVLGYPYDQKEILDQIFKSESVASGSQCADVGSEEFVECAVAYLSKKNLSGTKKIISPFLISKYELTRGAYLHFQQNVKKANNPQIEIRYQSDLIIHKLDYPQELTIYEANEFIKYINALEKFPHNYEYRLCTVYEWDYAVRSGEQKFFPWGNEYSGNKNYARLGTYDVGPVGSTNPTSNELYDLFGNVGEWGTSDIMESDNFLYVKFGHGYRMSSILPSFAGYAALEPISLTDPDNEHLAGLRLCSSY